MKNQQKKPHRIFLWIAIYFVAYLFMDYFDLASMIGIHMSRLNMDLFGTVFNTAIIIVLYAISFYFIDNRQNEKDERSKDTANILLLRTYMECVDNLNLLNDRKMIATYIIPKIDGNKAYSDNTVVSNLQTLPFSSFDVIMQLAQGGYITSHTLKSYLDVQREYQYLIAIRITFYDLVTPKTQEQETLVNDIQLRNQKIRMILESEIKRIESEEN